MNRLTVIFTVLIRSTFRILYKIPLIFRSFYQLYILYMFSARLTQYLRHEQFWLPLRDPSQGDHLCGKPGKPGNVGDFVSCQ